MARKQEKEQKENRKRTYKTKVDYIRQILEEVNVSEIHRPYLENMLDRLEQNLPALPTQKVIYAVNKFYLMEVSNAKAAAAKYAKGMSEEHKKKIGEALKKRWAEKRAKRD